ncbi:hypothetical protein HZB94_03640 [Candidatus Falkowbacteria bacterium]|nr:hypothetical protein [Candidatus Falkowbacteria bacterium]
MSNRLKISLIVAAGIAAIIIIILFFFSENQSELTEKDQSNNQGAAKIENEAPVIPAVSEKEKQAFSVKALAVAFVERFGSFSNQADYLNFKELLTTMTATMTNWVQKTYIPKLKKEHPADGFFYSISTKTGAVEIIEQKEDSMKIKMSAIRKETQEGKGEQEFLQDIILDLKKINNNWLIDGAYWGAKK